MSRVNLRYHLSCLSLVCLALPLGACGNETVNLGGGRISQSIQSGSRCAASPVLPESVRVTSQAELTELEGCEEIWGDLRVEIFAGADLSPLTSLRTIDGLLELGSYPEFPAEGVEPAELEALLAEVEAIAANGYLPSLQGLESLERVTSLDFYYLAAPDLAPLAGLRELSGHEGTLPVGFVGLHDSSVRTLHGLENVANIEDLVLSNNTELESLGGITLGPVVRNLNLINSPRLTSIAELGGVEATSTLYLDNTGISDLNELTELGFAEFGISLTGNRNLLDIDRLTDLDTASLWISSNAVLASIPALPHFLFFDRFSAIDNPALRTIQLALPEQGNAGSPRSLPEEVEVIEIGGNAQLTEVSISAGLMHARLLAIYQNPALEQVSLGTLTSVESLHISDNERLSRVDLGALDRAESLSVVNNPQLDPTELAVVRTFEANITGNAQPPASP